MEELNMERRTFLKLAAGAAAVAAGKHMIGLGPGRGLAAENSGDSPYQWAMVIDMAKCTGCGECSLACQARNDVAPGLQWNRVLEVGEARGETIYTTVPCMHCQHAPCVDICPVSATYYRSDGIVMMDYDRCIGCRYCQMACPYGVRVFNWETFEGENPAAAEYGQAEVPRRPRGVVEKCSFCYQRIDRGLANGLTPGVDPAATPACVMACPFGARAFGNLNDPYSPVSRLLASYPSERLRDILGTEPRVYYLSARQATPTREMVEEVCQ
jgi:Fe-S-cluster-containing dehydrogenase component